MPKRLSKQKNIRDVNVLAAHIVEEATSEPIPKNIAKESTKNPAEVKEMATQESDLAKDIINTLDKLERDRIICENLSTKYRMPFIRLYSVR